MRFLASLLFLCFCLGLAAPASAQSMKLIRDEEIEQILRDFSRPVFEQAGLSPSAVRIVLIEDSTLNAFVAGGQNIFFHTGLILQTKTAAELVGVIAHESGHIASGHLARMQGEVDNANLQALLANLLGFAVAIGSGSGEAGVAINSAAQNFALRGLLRHSRIQESAADQAGVRYLQGAGLPVEGFLSFMELLAGQELLPESQQSEYVRTHPVSQDRVDFLRNVTEQQSSRGKTPASWDEKLALMQAKLTGFIYPDRALLKKGDGFAERYGRAIAHYRKGNIPLALKEIDTLITDHPDNAYLHELKGQVLFENGRVNEALEPYARAVERAPRSGLIAAAYGHALLEAKPSKPEQAVRQFERALSIEPKMSRSHHLLAIAYGKLGREGMSRLHLAEEDLLQGKLGDARTEANLALNALPAGSASRLRALDILANIEQAEKRAKKR